MPPETEHATDHDLLIEIRTQLRTLITTIGDAGIPAKCATHEQEHKANNARIRTMENRMWAVVMVLVAAIITGAVGILFRH